MFMAYFSDLFRHRFVFIMIAISTSLSGFAVMLSPLSFNIKYGGLFLIAAGTYTAMPLIGELFILCYRCCLMVYSVLV